MCVIASLAGVVVTAVVATPPAKVLAATVTAPGDTAGVCTQTVSTTFNISVSRSGSVCTVTFSNGWRETDLWTFPSGITSFNFTAQGAKGGSAADYPGRGGRIVGTLDLSAVSNPTLYIQVGSTWGQAADIRLNGTALTNRIVVAGAGGGCGTDNTDGCASTGGGGGHAGTLTGASIPASRVVNGGTGNWGTGFGGVYGGSGGSTSGGAGGTGDTGGQCGGPLNGQTGSLGFGGSGSNNGCGSGGRGGDGYFGGGGGGGSSIADANVRPGGGGGGGSSYTDSRYVPLAGLEYNGGYNTSVSVVTLQYTATSNSVSQQPSNGQVGVALATQPAVTLQSGGTAAAGVTVTAALGTSPSPSGTQNTPALAGTLTAVTNASGVATFSNLAINGPTGSYTLSFSATGYPTATSNSLTLSVGAASALKVSTQPSSGGTSGGVIPGSPAVTVVDAGGNAITSHPSTSVSVTASPGTIGGTTSVNTSSGVASFTAATLTGVISPTTHTLTFSASGLTSVTTSNFTMGAGGSASSLAIGTQPVGNVGIGSNLSTQPVVRVVDVSGNVITGHPTTTVTATIASGPSAGVLGGAAVNTSSGVATFSGMNISGAGGDYTVTFSAPGLGSVTSATFSVNRTAQSITFGSLSAKSFGDSAFRITATASSGLVVAFSSTTPGVCSVAGDTTITGGSATAAVVTLLGAGTCTIATNQAGNDTFAAAAQQSQSFTVNPAAQATLTLTNPSTLNYGNGLNLATSGGSGTGAVSYALIGGAGTAQCVLNGTTGAMTFGSVGTCTVQATKAADTNYTVKQSAQQVLTVAQAPQATSFTSASPTNPLPGGTYAVTATASSGLTPALAILAGSGTVCSLAGSTVSFLASGTCTLIAAQAGNANYLPANPEAQQSIVVGSLNQNITFTQPTNMNFGDPNKLLTASSSSGLAVTLTSQTTSVCSMSGAVVAIVAVGQCEIKATQAGNSRFAAASDVYRTFDIVAVVATAPTIRSASVSSGAFTVGFTAPGFDGGASIVGYRLVATPTGAGTTVTDDACVTSPCTINGLTNGTEYTVTVAAINAAGVGGASTASPAMTPVTNALAVQSLLSTPGDGQLAISWTAPADFGGGAFVQYEVRLRQSGSSWPVSATQTVSSSASGSVTLTGLDNSTEYEVQVITITAANSSSYEGNTAVVAAIPRRVPSVPRSLVAIQTAATSVLISWAMPLSDGGAAITSYSVSFSGGVSCGAVTINVATKAGSCVASGLAYSTTYSISVVAINVAGSSIAATTSHTTQAAPASTGSDDSSTSTTTSSTVPGGVSSTTLPSRSRTTTTLPRSTSTQTTVPVDETGDNNSTTGSDEETSTGAKSPTIGALAPLLARSGPMVVMSVEGKVSTPETTFTAEGFSIVGGGVNIDMVALGGTKLSDTTTGRVMICGAGAMSFSLVGLQPQSMVVVWLRPDSTRLMDDMTTTNGSIELGVQLPSDLAAGDHEMQIDMVNERGEESAMAAGFRFEPICGKRNNPINAGTLLVGFSVLALGFLLVAGFRRRQRDSEPTL